MIRVGHSYDIHNLTSGKGFKIGGVFIECDYEVEAISDGDIVFHTLSESILGALSLGDLGEYYTEKNSKNLDSSIILNDTLTKMRDKNYRISNIDLTIVADHPKLKPFREVIKENLIKLINIKENQLNVKFTTTENNAPNTISAYCSCLLLHNTVKFE